MLFFTGFVHLIILTVNGNSVSTSARNQIALQLEKYIATATKPSASGTKLADLVFLIVGTLQRML